MNDKKASELQALTLRIQAGDQSALGPIFEMLRPRLRSAIRLRVNRRIRRREDESDILQEAYFAAANDFPRYAAAPRVPVYMWLRKLVQQRMLDAHRKHLSCQKEPLVVRSPFIAVVFLKRMALRRFQSRIKSPMT